MFIIKKIISFFIISIAIVISVISLISFTQKTQAQIIGSLQSIVPAGFSFTKDLQLGDTDPDVVQLQKVLNADPATTVAFSDTGSRGYESSYFGEKTKNAIIKLQNKYRQVILTPVGLTEGDGLVYKTTRNQLNLLIGVLTTLNSTGLPQSRVSPSVAPASTASISITPQQSTSPQLQMPTCQFVEFLINIGAISSAKANPARAALGCPTLVPAPNFSTCQFIDILITIGAIAPAKVDLARSVLSCSSPLSSTYTYQPYQQSYYYVSTSTNRSVFIWGTATTTGSSTPVVDLPLGQATSTGHTASTTDQASTTTVDYNDFDDTSLIAEEDEGGGSPAPRVIFNGMVSAVTDCYKDDGEKGRMKAVTVSSCPEGQAVIPTTGAAGTVKFLWDSVDVQYNSAQGHRLPAVGETVFGVANSGPGKEADVLNKCPRTTPTGAVNPNDIPGAKWIGFMLDYQLGPSKGCATLTDSATEQYTQYYHTYPPPGSNTSLGLGLLNLAQIEVVLNCSQYQGQMRTLNGLETKARACYFEPDGGHAGHCTCDYYNKTESNNVW